MNSDNLPTWTRRNWIALAGLAAAGAAASGGVRAQGASASQTSSATAAKPAPIDVAVLLGAANTLIDFGGPWEVLSSSGRFNVYSVADTRKPVICDDGRTFDTRRPISGLTVIPDYTFDDAPQPRIIVVGGQGDAETPEGKASEARKLAWLRRAAARAELTSSVCVGAFVLADAGLLDGRSATTNRFAYDRLEKAYPKVKVVRDVRFVEDGPVMTATGLTAGIDLALRITDRFCGRKVAQRLAGYEEWPGTAWMV